MTAYHLIPLSSVLYTSGRRLSFVASTTCRQYSGPLGDRDPTESGFQTHSLPSFAQSQIIPLTCLHSNAYEATAVRWGHQATMDERNSFTISFARPSLSAVESLGPLARNVQCRVPCEVSAALILRTYEVQIFLQATELRCQFWRASSGPLPCGAFPANLPRPGAPVWALRPALSPQVLRRNWTREFSPDRDK